MSKENARSDSTKNVTEGLAVIRDLRYMTSIGRFDGPIPDFDISAYDFPATFEPETEDQKLQLVEDCEALLGKEKMSPDEFNLFVSKMIDILGGKRLSRDEDGSNMLKDEQRSRTISFGRYQSDRLNFGWIEFGPIWFDRFSHDLRERVDQTGKPEIFTEVTFGFSDYRHLLRPYPAITQHIYLPEEHPLISGKMIALGMNQYDRSLVTSPREITRERLQEICRKVFEVFKNQDAIPVSASSYQ